MGHRTGAKRRPGPRRTPDNMMGTPHRETLPCAYHPGVDPPKKPPLVRNLADRDWRRRAAETLYDSEMFMRSVGHPDPALVYDEEHDLFRFRDGRFAFSREWADWPLLRKRGRMMEEL
jgi:hypothetical protein